MDDSNGGDKRVVMAGDEIRKFLSAVDGRVNGCNIGKRPVADAFKPQKKNNCKCSTACN